MALQVLTLIWFGMIIRVAYGVVSGKAAQDDRSEDEADEEEVEEEEYEVDDWDTKTPTLPSVQPLEQEVVKEENVNWMQGRTSSPSSLARGRGRRAGSARASAISIPDKKELLGRIGCDKPVS
jgi:acyl-CoA-dependent ceramide synthase